MSDDEITFKCGLAGCKIQEPHIHPVNRALSGHLGIGQITQSGQGSYMVPVDQAKELELKKLRAENELMREALIQIIKPDEQNEADVARECLAKLTKRTNPTF